MSQWHFSSITEKVLWALCEGQNWHSGNQGVRMCVRGSKEDWNTWPLFCGCWNRADGKRSVRSTNEKRVSLQGELARCRNCAVNTPFGATEGATDTHKACTPASVCDTLAKVCFCTYAMSGFVSILLCTQIKLTLPWPLPALLFCGRVKVTDENQPSSLITHTLTCMTITLMLCGHEVSTCPLASLQCVCPLSDSLTFSAAESHRSTYNRGRETETMRETRGCGGVGSGRYAVGLMEW